jgi:hypothetical protein
MKSLALILLTACGSHAHEAMPDAAPDARPADAALPRPVLPTAKSAGGPVIAAPRVLPIFFAGDAATQQQLQGFFTALAGSTYWAATTQEYGVGPLSALPSVVLSTPPPTTDDQVQALLHAMADGHHAGWPAHDANTIYAVFLPAGVTITAPYGTSCVGFDGYHGETQADSILYAVMPRCPQFTLTDAVSHELIEAATDPFVFTAPAYDGLDTQHLAWELITGGEVGDLCESLVQAYQWQVGGLGVQRTWSNAAAAAGHDPCVPALVRAYVVAVPRLVDQLKLDLGGGQVQTAGIAIPVGTSRTIPVDAYADGPTGSWTVSAVDMAAQQHNPAELELSWDKTTAKAGDQLMLTIKHVASGSNGASSFAVFSSTDGTTASVWWGVVGN